MSNPCPDCHVLPGSGHDDGCDVARCTLCGMQRITCEHRGSSDGWGAMWTGTFPGLIEVSDLGLSNLNHLYILAELGKVVWNRKSQRWERPRPMSNYGDFPLPQELEHLRGVRTEYEDVNGTGACMLELKDDESTCRTWLDFREMRQLAMHLLKLADEAEHEFLKAHGLHE